MHFFYRSLAILCALLFPLSAMSQESSQLRYDCPYLQDETLQTIGALSQGKDGWFFRQSDIRTYYDVLPHTKDFLKRLNEAFAAQDTTLLLLALPPRPLVAEEFIDYSQPGFSLFQPSEAEAYRKHYIKALKAIGLEVLDVYPSSKGVQKETGLHFFFKRDAHWTTYGSELTAQKIAEYMQKFERYKNAKKLTFKTEVVGDLALREVTANEIDRLCADDIPAEPYPDYQTMMIAGEGEDALFGGTDDKPLVLVGSSFSAQEIFNFDGFLSQHTGLEVANYAISGGQLFNGLVSYVSMPMSKRLQPDFLLWEQLAHYDFNEKDALFRQTIPAVYGECSEKEALAVGQVNLAKGDQLLLEAPEEIKAQGARYYLFLESTVPSMAHFTLELEHANGDGEWFVVDRRDRFNNSGRFFVELSQEIEAPLTEVKYVASQEMKGNLKARLCMISEQSKGNDDA